MVFFKGVYENIENFNKNVIKGLRTKAKSLAENIHQIKKKLLTKLNAQSIYKKLQHNTQELIKKTQIKNLYIKTKNLTEKINSNFYNRVQALYCTIYQKIYTKTHPFLQKTKEFFFQKNQKLQYFLSPALILLSKIYHYLIILVSKTCAILTFIIEKTATFIHLTMDNLDRLSQYVHRRLYVRKILSARNQWYTNKKGDFYNPKIKATIYPSWECTWNIESPNDSYHGYESKKQAKEAAFKMWMKLRRLKIRLDKGCLDTKISINLTKKMLSNKIQLRKPTFQDISHILTLMEPFDPTQTEDSMRARIQTYSHKPNYQMLVAERGKKVIGFIAFVFYDLFTCEGKRCRIEGLAVDAKEQDLSVKRKLIQAAEAFARDNKGIIVDLTTDLNHAGDSTHDLYKLLGYSNEVDTVQAYLKKELG